MKIFAFLLIMLLVSASAHAQTYNQNGNAVVEPKTGWMMFDPKENSWNQIRAMNASPVKNVYNGESVKTYDDVKSAWDKIKVKKFGPNTTKCVKKDNGFVCN